VRNEVQTTDKELLVGNRCVEQGKKYTLLHDRVSMQYRT